MHAQLRRLKNDSSILEDASITAIPDHKSKVFFEYVNIPRLSHVRAGSSPEKQKVISKEQEEQVDFLNSFSKTLENIKPK